MDSSPLAAAGSSLAIERSPLTRVRATNRPPTPLRGEAQTLSLLPAASDWAALLGGGHLGAGECAALNGLARVRRVPAGARVFQRGQTAGGVVLLAEGDVVLGVQAEEGGFHTERHLHGPAWLDGAATWLEASHALDARAMTLASIIELPREALQAAIERHPALARRIIVALAGEARAQALSTHDLMHKDAPARLAAWLGDHCQPDPAEPVRGLVQLPMRKRDIASQLAITPETLSRLMRSFTSQGVLRVDGYTVHVLDRRQLQRLAQS